MKKVILTLIATATLALLGGSSASAANVAWTGASNADWSAGTNWSGGVVPGSANTALFNTTGTTVVANAIADQSVLSISFDTAAGSYTIGTTGGNKLLLTTAGSIQMLATMTGTGVTETINSPLLIGSGATVQTYTFANNSNDNTSALVIGGPVSFGTTSTGTLTINGSNSGANLISGNISNGTSSAVSLIKSGAGTWNLSGSNSYSGTTTVTTGTLVLSGSIGNSSNIIVNNSAATLNETSAGVISGATGSLTLSAGTVNLAGSNNFNGPTSQTGGTLNLTGTLNNTAITVNNAAAVFNESSTGVISGSALTKLSAGTMTLAGANTSTGGVSISGGLLNIANASALGAGTFTLTGGTVDNTTGSALTIAGNNAKSFGGTVIFADTNAINLGTGTSTLTANSTINVAGAALTDGGAYSGAFTLTKTGTGNLILTDASNSSSISTLNVSAGTLNIADQFTVSGTTTIATGALLSISGHNTKLSSGALSVSGTLLLDDRGTGNATTVARLAAAGGLSLSNKGSLVYQGSDVTLNSLNVYASGGVTINPGVSTITVQPNNGNAAKLTLAAITRNGGIALLNGTNLGSAAPSTGGVGNLFSTAPTLVGTTTSTGTIAAGVYNTKIAPIFIGESGVASGLNGTVTGTANTFVTYNTTNGYRPLNPTDEFFNTSSISSSGSLTSGATGNNVYVSSNATSGLTQSINSLVINGGNLAIGNGTTLTDASGALLFVTSNTISGGNLALGNGVSGSLEGLITVNAGVNAVISANITPTGSMVGLTPNGAGTLTLAGQNTYTGVTNVNTGSTLLLGSSTTGTISGPVGAVATQLINNGGIIAADNQARTIANTMWVQAGIATFNGSNDVTFTGNTLGAGYAGNNIALIIGSSGLSGRNFRVLNTGVTTIAGGLTNNSSGESILVGSSANLVITGSISDTLSGATQSGIILSFGALGNGGNLTISGSNNFLSTISAVSAQSYNTLTFGGTAPLANAAWTLNNSNPWYFQALTNNYTLTTPFTSVGNNSGTGLAFAGANNLTMSGTIAFNASTVSTPVITNLATGTITLSGTISQAQAIVGGINFLGTGNTVLSSSSTLAAGGSVESLLKTGPGTLTIASVANNMTGANTFNGGTIVLDYSTNNTNKLAQNTVAAANAAELSLSSINLQLNGGSYAQTLGAATSGTNGTTLLGGQSSISQTGASTATLALGAITRAANSGGALNIGGTGTFVTTTTGTTNGILGGYATVGGAGSADWAVSGTAGTPTAITALGSYATLSNATTTAASNYLFSGSGSLTTSSTAQTVNSLKISATTDLALGNNLTIASGGLLFTGGSPVTISGATLASGSGNDLIIQQFGAGNLTISSTIGGGTNALTVSGLGAGTVILSGANTYSGGTFLNGPAVQISADNNLGAAAGAITFRGGTLQDTNTGSFTMSRGVVVGANGGTIGVTTGGTLTLAGVVSGGTGGAALNFGSTGYAGTVVLTGSNTIGGAININAGTVRYGAGNSIALGADAINATGNSPNRSLSPVTVNGGILDINGNAANLGNLTLVSGSIIDSNVTPGALSAYSFTLESGTVGAALTDSAVYSAGVLQAGSNITALNKTTSGTVVMTGNNTYSGATLISNGTLQIGNGGATGSLGSGNVNTSAAAPPGTSFTASPGSIAFNRNNTYTVANAITGAGSVSQIGSGTTVLTNVNSYTGGTSVNAGTLAVNGSLTGNGTVTVGNNTAVATLAGNGTIAGAVVTSTTGSNVAHVAPGATPGAVGTLTIGNLGFTVGNGTAFDFDLNTAVTAGGTSNDLIAMTGGTLTFGGTTTFNFNALSSLSTSGTYTLVSGAGSIAGFNAANFNTTGLGALTATFTSTGTAVMVSFSSAVVTPTSAYFNGLGSNLGTAGNFDATVSGTVANLGAPGATTNVFISANRNTATSLVTSAPQTINSLNFGVGSGTNSGITVSGTSALTITGSAVNGNTAGSGITTTGTGSNTISAPLVLGASQTWTVDTGGTLTVSGTVSGSGTALTKSGAGKLVLSGSNTYDGGTTLAAGTMVAANSTTTSGGAIVNGPFGKGTLTLNGGTTLQDNGTAITLANNLSLGGTITLSSTGAGSLTFDGTTLTAPATVTLTSDTTLNVLNTTTIVDNITGNFVLTKIGAGTLNLTGTTTSTAATTVTTGTLSIAKGNSIGSGAISLANATTLQYTGANGTVGQNITVTSGSATINNSGSNVLTLSGTLNKNGTTLNISGGLNVITGQIVGSSANSDVNYINHTTTGLTNTSTYNGPTTISGTSTLLTGVNNALPVTTFTDLTMGASSDVASSVNTLDLLGTSQTVASLTSTGTGTNQIISSNGNASTPTIGAGASTGTGTLTVNVTSGTSTYGGLLGDSNLSRNANNFSLTKSGTGTLALTRSTGNTYTGGTTISAGTLKVSNTSGSATGSGAFNLGSLGIVTGTGTIASSSNTITGNVTPGNGGGDTTSVLTMTATGTTTFTNASLTFNLGTGANLGQSTSLAFGSTASVLFGTSGTSLTLNLASGPIVPDTTQYVLFTSTSSTNPFSDLVTDGNGHILNFGSLIINSSQPNGYYANSYLKLITLGGGAGFNIDVEVVPEPGTWALMLGGLAMLAIFQRARRKSN